MNHFPWRQLSSSQETEYHVPGTRLTQNFCTICVQLNKKMKEKALLAERTINASDLRETERSFNNSSNLRVHMTKPTDKLHFELVRKWMLVEIEKWSKSKKRKRGATLKGFFGTTSATTSSDKKAKKSHDGFTQEQKCDAKLCWATTVACCDLAISLGDKPSFKAWQLSSVGLNGSEHKKEKEEKVLAAPNKRTTGVYIVGIAAATKKEMAAEMIQGLNENILPSLHINHDIYKDKQNSKQVRWLFLILFSF